MSSLKYRSPLHATSLGWVAALIFAIAIVILLFWQNTFAQKASTAERFQIVAFGDMPYTLPGDYAKFDRLIARINQLNPAFSVHIGDIKDGHSQCSEAVYGEVLKRFKTFKAPLVFTPGDNDWSDCHRPDAGGYDPLERLQVIRTLFFLSNPGYEKTLSLARQSDTPGYEDFVENTWWSEGGILFGAIHTVGENNNLPSEDEPDKKKNKKASVGNKAEYARRNAANLAWLDEIFLQAEKQHAQGVVLFTHADPFFEKKPEKRTGLNDTIAALRKHTLAYGKPVLLVHGSTHTYRIDKPLVHEDTNEVVGNFTRLLVFGEQDIQAVKITIDPDEPELFTIHPLLIPENLRKPG